LEQHCTQTQTIAPHLRQSLEILRVPAAELHNIVREELQFNPLLEEIAPEGMISIDHPDPEAPPDDEDPNGEIDFNENYPNGLNREAREYFFEDQVQCETDNHRRDFPFNSIATPISLYDHLRQQLQMADLSKEETEVIPFIFGSLDERGFLVDTEEEIARHARQPTDVVRSALEIIRNLDPVGIACVDTRECLLYQLKAKGKGDSIAAKIVQKHYDWLLHNNWTSIRNACQVEMSEVARAIGEIAHCDPIPGRHFDNSVTQGIIPDVYVRKGIYGEWIIRLNNEFIPSLRLNQNYKDRMGSRELNRGDKNYIRLKMRSGQLLIQALQQRQKTLLQVVRAIIEEQKHFFEWGPDGLKPLILRTLAQKLHVHETTVCRAVDDKFADTPFGVFPLKYFFAKGLSSEDGSVVVNNLVKRRIADIVGGEDVTHPVSDQKIANILKNEKICIARRTVAKYRDTLGILPANLRRKHH
jgi:RNA polymerase sigma-54 factor